MYAHTCIREIFVTYTPLPTERVLCSHQVKQRRFISESRCKGRIRLSDCLYNRKNLSNRKKQTLRTPINKRISGKKKMAPLLAREANRTFHSKNLRLSLIFLTWPHSFLSIPHKVLFCIAPYSWQRSTPLSFHLCREYSCQFQKLLLRQQACYPLTHQLK